MLARIDPVTYQAELDQAQAKLTQDQALLANAKVDLERYTRLAKTDYATKQQADTQQATVAQLQAQIAWDKAAVDSAQAYVDYCTITSPIDGRTGFRQVDAGNIIHASDATGIVVITQLRPISVVFTLPETDLGQVNAGMAKGPAHGPGAAGRQHGAGRGGQARGDRQPGRRHDRHDPPQGDLPEQEPAALAGPVRERQAPGRDAPRRARRAGGGGPAGTRRDLRLPRRGRQGAHADGRGRPGGCGQRGDRQGPDAGPDRRDLGLRPAQGRHHSCASTRPRPQRRRPTEAHERLRTLHPASGRDRASCRGGAAGRRPGLSRPLGVVAAAGRLPDDPGDDPAARRRSRHHGGPRHRPARAPAWPDPLARTR